MAIATKSIDAENACSTGEPDLCDAIGTRSPPLASANEIGREKCRRTVAKGRYVNQSGFRSEC